MSREAGVSSTLGRTVVKKDLGMLSRARERRHKLTPADMAKRVTRSQGLLNMLRRGARRGRAGAGLRIFLDEAKIELTPYRNSRKDRIIEQAAGDAGILGVNHRSRTQGLMILGIWISDGSKWMHIFRKNEPVNTETFCAAMDSFFDWLSQRSD